MITGNNNNYADNGSSINDVDINITLPPMPDPIIPLQFPPRADYFTGRKKQLAQLINDLQPRKIVALCGAGGMGKTALAAEAVYTLIGENNKPPKDFPDGVIFHSFYSNPSIESAMIEIAVSFGIEIQGFSAQQAVKKALNGKTALIVLDGAEDADDLPLILSLMGGCGVLITTRDKQDAPAGREDMQPLLIEDAVALLGKWAEKQIDNKEVAIQICECVGGLPLALQLVGAYLNKTHDSASNYLQWLKKALEPNKAEHRHQSIRVLLDRSVAQLSNEEQQLLAIFGCLAMKPVFLFIFMKIFESSNSKIVKHLLSIIDFFYKPKRIKKSDIKEIANQLIFLGLLQQPKNHQYEVAHALIHTYARERIPLSNKTFERLVYFYTLFIITINEDGLKGYHLLDTQKAHIFYLIERAHQQKMWVAVINLVVAIEGYLDIRGYWGDLKYILSLALTATQATGQRNIEGVILGSLGITYNDLGKKNKAIEYYQKALFISKEIGDRQMEGSCLSNLGNTYKNLDERDKAADLYQQALLISREIGDRKLEGNCLSNLGGTYDDLGEQNKAINFYQQALFIGKEIGDRQIESNCLGNLGITYSNSGEQYKALDLYQQALLISKEIGDRQTEGNQLNNLGNTYRNLDKLEEAIDFHQQALVIGKAIGYRQGEGRFLGSLGETYYQSGKLEEAINSYQQALAISKEIGNQQIESNNLNYLGIIYNDLGEHDKAVNFYQQALVISKEIGDQDGGARHLNNLGSVYIDLEQFNIARNYIQQALVIWEEINSPHAETARDNLKNLDQSITDSKE